MNAIAPAAVLAAALSATILCEPAQKDRDLMQGTWTIESFIANGESIPAETLKSWRRIVDGQRVVWKQGDQTLVELSIQFDPTKKPMILDSTIAAGDAKGQTMLAIYELSGDELRMCFAPPGKPRPKEFTSTPGSDLLLYTAKRVKP